jgi:two-component system, NtrC family, nitrogen regulation sensor histidine kinase NtrY
MTSNTVEEPQIGSWRGGFDFRHRFSAVSAMTVVVASILCGLATYVILTGLTPIKPTQPLVLTLLIANLILVAAMAGLIGWQMLRLFMARRRGIAGASLHIRMVGLFGLIAVLPAIIVAVFASVTLNRGLDAWFSERTRAIVDTSVTVAEAYITEHGQVTRQTMVQIAADLSQQRELFDKDRPAFIKRMASHALLRGLSAAFLVDRDRKVLDVSVTANKQVQFQAPTDAMFETAGKGEIVIINPGNTSVIRALFKLENFDNRYLYIYRQIDPEVLRQLAKAQESKVEFDQLLNSRQGVQITFAIMYTGVSCIFLLAAVWIAMWFADRLVEPVVQLVNASRRISRGELGVKVPEGRGPGDLSTLTLTFNRMTQQLKSQRDELVATNTQLDARRRFTEAMLAGVSAGVIGLDAAGRITLVNRSAESLLQQDSADLSGRNLADVLPGFVGVFEQCREKPSGSAEDNVNIRTGTQERNFVVRATTEKSAEEDHGYVLTFDDMTDLVSAQRNSAWSDIARRIAHEIKNPLTPIQLSAERLKRKYGKEITTDPHVFEQCTETIIRQVGDIGRMVDEFSSFARMPAAVMERDDITRVVREAVILQRVSSSDITFDVNLPENLPSFAFDRRLISQTVINLVKNAREAIEARQQDSLDPPGRISVDVEMSDDLAWIRITDNGIGLPSENRSRLTEPYMTTREKGTGLGLAIVQRIIEEHGGKLTLEDAPDVANGGTGARVSFCLPRNNAVTDKNTRPKN